MSGFVQIPYAVGSKVWLARIRKETEWIVCPACNGTLRHTVTMGNGETHVVWCTECGADRRHDYDWCVDREGPVGRVRSYPIRAEVHEVTLDEVEVRGDEVSYQARTEDGTGHYIYKCDGLFPTEAEARAHAKTVLAPAAQREEDERLASYLSQGRRTDRAKEAARSAEFWLHHRKEQAGRLAAIDRRIARLKEVKP